MILAQFEHLTDAGMPLAATLEGLDVRTRQGISGCRGPCILPTTSKKTGVPATVCRISHLSCSLSCDSP